MVYHWQNWGSYLHISVFLSSAARKNVRLWQYNFVPGTLICPYSLTRNCFSCDRLSAIADAFSSPSRHHPPPHCAWCIITNCFQFVAFRMLWWALPSPNVARSSTQWRVGQCTYHLALPWCLALWEIFPVAPPSMTPLLRVILLESLSTEAFSSCLVCHLQNGALKTLWHFKNFMKSIIALIQ